MSETVNAETTKPVMHLWVESRNIEVQSVAGTESRICSFRDGEVHETAWENYADIEEQYPVILKVAVLSGITVYEYDPRVSKVDPVEPKLIPFYRFVNNLVRYSFVLDKYVISTKGLMLSNAHNLRMENPEIVIRYVLDHIRPDDTVTFSTKGFYSGMDGGTFTVTKTIHTDGLDHVEYTVNDQLRDMFISRQSSIFE